VLTIGTHKRDQIVVIVLGARTTNAILLERDGAGFTFLNYTLQSTPVTAQQSSQSKGPVLGQDVLVEHFKRVYQALDAQTKRVIMVIGMGDSVLRHAELPAMSASELRALIQINSKNLLKQELKDYTVDCHILSRVADAKDKDGAKTPSKCNVLVGGARTTVVRELTEALVSAELQPEHITLSQVGLVNAAWLAMPDVLKAGVIALVDIGFASSTVSFLVRGEVILSRVVGIGAQTFTHGLAESMSISHQAAEGAILVMTDKVRAQLQGLLAPLHHELRASIDFFEDEHSEHVERVFVSGGSARSEFIVEALAGGLTLPVSRWDPTKTLKLKLPAQRKDEVAKDGPQLVVAIGAAMTWFDQQLLHIDFLADKHEAAERRRRDPMRWGVRIAAMLIVSMLVWVGVLSVKWLQGQTALENAAKALNTVQKRAIKVQVLSKRIGEIDKALRVLTRHATNRFLYAIPLGEIPATVVDNIQMVQIKMEEGLTLTAAVKENRVGEKVIPAKPATMTQRYILTLQAKDKGEPPATDEFIKALTELEWFSNNLRKVDPVRLKERGAEQVDPNDTSKTFILLTIECTFPDKVVQDD
jgi:type IV pilus assembly protein PilM